MERDITNDYTAIIIFTYYFYKILLNQIIRRPTVYEHQQGEVFRIIKIHKEKMTKYYVLRLNKIILSSHVCTEQYKYGHQNSVELH